MPDPTAKVHRELRRGNHGADVAALQHHLNEFASSHAQLTDFRLASDGVLGRATQHATGRAAYLLGLPESRQGEIQHGRIAEHVQTLIRHPDQRSHGEKAEAIKRQAAILHHRQHPPSGLAAVRVTPTPGAPHWGGAGDVVAQFVEPFMIHRGLLLGDGKRTPAENQAAGGSPTSDHLTTHTMAFARDFPTFAGEDDARALASAMGAPSWSPNSYATFDVDVDGHRFRVQILWGAAIGHGDHVHSGVSSA